MRSRRLIVPLFAIGLLVTACDRSDRDVQVQSDTMAAGISPGAADSLTRGLTAPPVGTREVLVALSGEGLQFVDAATGRTRLVPFGWERGTVEGAFNALRRVGPGVACGTGLQGVRVGEGLTLWFDDVTFVGWSADGSDDIDAMTMAGIGVGSSKAEMDAVIGSTYAEVPGGVIFTSGGLRGILDGADETSRIRFISAGTVCDPA